MLLMACTLYGQSAEVETYLTRIGEMDSLTGVAMRGQLNVTTAFTLSKNKEQYDQMGLSDKDRLQKAQVEALYFMIKYTQVKASALKLSMQRKHFEKADHYFDSLLSVQGMNRLLPLDSVLDVFHQQNMKRLKKE